MSEKKERLRGVAWKRHATKVHGPAAAARKSGTTAGRPRAAKNESGGPIWNGAGKRPNKGERQQQNERDCG
ncbi:MAG: hypothetical protein DMG49_10370 [Acidobacteria bacterium]|nr:MAG: hypothetical protein DMG49_10370 [Acidobacteriota bacterium]